MGVGYAVSVVVSTPIISPNGPKTSACKVTAARTKKPFGPSGELATNVRSALKIMFSLLSMGLIDKELNDNDWTSACVKPGVNVDRVKPARPGANNPMVLSAPGVATAC